ncbi:ABC transporter permease [Clostridium sp. MSJ-11]|uniref:ABC transporter permease n=1 Tax=Clostridium mobile TaxID=2841512 RepID=A0ABS6ELI2_9CLOT|nr:ABC transporter permease [Clostridium mobile]MBU5486081.1 ABC transporter permease [Clostridium mobile]
MNSLDIIRMGLKNLWRRKLRTFLTILGVIIGTSSIITMLSLGFGMSDSFQKEISNIGSLNTINVMENYGMGGPGGGSLNKKKVYLDDKAIKELEEIDGVEVVTPMMDLNMKIKTGKYSAHINLRGIDPETMEAFDFKLEEGKYLKKNDTFNLIFGGSIKHYFYDEKRTGGSFKEPNIKPLKDKFTMNFNLYDENGKEKTPKEPMKVNVVGVLKEGDFQKDNYVYMNIKQVEKLKKEQQKLDGNRNRQNGNNKNKYSQILVKVKDVNRVAEIQKKIKDMGYEAYSLNDMLESLNKVSLTIQGVLGGIGAVSLLVAALGITNTMIMSIYERTREIGVMKVIGAQIKDIKRIFLFEAGTIGLLGGFMGIGISYGFSSIINFLGRNVNMLGYGGGPATETKLSIIPIWLVFAALAFTTLVGIVSGYYPAKRATKLSALEAIKTE